MIFSKADPEFRAITIVVETEDEFDQLMAIASNVANNRVNHTPQVVQAAKNLHQLLIRADQIK